MEAQSGTWAEQMDIVEEGLHTSMHALPKDSTLYTFSLHNAGTGTAFTYTLQEPARDTQLANNTNNILMYHTEKNGNSNVRNYHYSILPKCTSSVRL